jgi:hypothetical protein
LTGATEVLQYLPVGGNMKRFTVLFFFGLFAYGVVWTTKAPLPQARAGAGCVVYNDTVYVIGGRGSSSVQYATNYVYDPITDNWSSKSSMTYARAHIGCALVNGKIYAIGGWIGATATGIVEEYDPIADSWTTKTPMPTPRYTYGMAVVNDKIYVIGGMDMNGNVFSVVEEYDPVGDSWTTKTPMPTQRFGPGCAVYNDSIYVFGGSTVIGGGLTTANQCYDPVSDTWISKANMPTSRYSLAGFTLQDKIWALGGYNYYSYLTTLEMYLPAANTWYTDQGMQYSRQSIAVGKLDEYYIYIIGGWNNGALDYNEEGWFEVGIAEQYTDPMTITAGPNPFKDVTHITFQSGHSEVIKTVKIYDAMGRLVKSLRPVHDDLAIARVGWDGRDDDGNMLPNGTYLLVVEAEGITHTKKLVLLK